MAAPTPNLVLSILFTIKFIAGSPSEDLGECFCDNGCYKAKDTPFRLQCCDDICENAAERRTENLCNEHCKCYQTIKNNKAHHKVELTLCEDNLTETRSKTKNLEKEILAREERIQELEDELARLNQSHKELSESRQFIAALVTPLCLFGVIALGFLLFTCAKEPRGTLCQKFRGRKGGSSLGKAGSSISSNSFSQLVRNSKLSEFKHTAESKDTESDRGYQGGSNSSSLRPACLKSASTGGSCLADGLLIAKSVGSARSSTRSTISTAVPGLRPPHLEGESHNRSPSPCSHLAIPRQPEVLPGEDASAHARSPFQPLFQPIGTNLSANLTAPHIYQLPLPRTYPTATAPEYGVDMAGGDAATVCLRNHGASGPLGGSGNAIASAGTAIPSANRLPRFGEQPTNNQSRRESEAKKTKLDSSAYKLASLNITDRRINVDAADLKISD